MKRGKIADCIISQSNIKQIDYEEKLHEIMTGVNVKKEEDEKNKREEEIMNKKLKEIENERKIDYFLNLNLFDDYKENIKSEETSKLIINDDIERLGKNKEENKEYIPLELKDLIQLDNGLNQINQNLNFGRHQNQQISINAQISNNKPQLIEENEEDIIQIKVKPHNITKTQIKVDNLTMKIIQSNYNKILQINKNHSTITSLNSLSLVSNKDNHSKLICEYKKEKEISNQLSSILHTNLSVINNTQFDNYNNPLIQEKTNKTMKKQPKNICFYQMNSREEKLLQAKQLLEEKLTPQEKEVIANAAKEIALLKQEYSFRLKERKVQEHQVKEIKQDYKRFIAQSQNELKILQKKYSTEFKGIINKYKLDIYNDELKPKAEKYIQKVSNELPLLEKQSNSIQTQLKNRENEYIFQTNIILNQIQIIQNENNGLIKRIKEFEEQRLWNTIDNDKSLIKTVSQLSCVLTGENNYTSNNNINSSNTQNNKIHKKKDTKFCITINQNDNNDNDDLFIKPSTRQCKILAFTQKTEGTKQETNESTHQPLEEIELKFSEHYHKKGNNEVIIKEKFQSNGVIVKEYNTGKKELLFPSGQKKEVFPDGYQVVYYVNGDIKQNFPNNSKELYYYSKEKTIQVKYSDGRNYIKFEDGHIESI